MSDSDQPKCPVDHQTREAWLKKAQQANKSGQANAFKHPGSAYTAPQQDSTITNNNTKTWGQTIGGLFWATPSSSTLATNTTSPAPAQVPVTKQIKAPHPIPEGTPEGATCPVDHGARETWVSKVTGLGSKPSESAASGSAVKAPKTVRAPEAIEVPGECSSDKLESSGDITFTSNVDLPEDREISSIPRTGADSNWIYPSQKQFFNAMKRKDWNPDAQDMKTIVPIHNMVNERAWMYIQMWERGQGGEKCGGVQLTSFKGDSKKVTPRAMIRGWLGNDLPFDRHDWTIDRCGTSVDYVIDFYARNPDPNSAAGKNSNGPTFYLDVRPKLNSWAGVKLRISKAFGF